MEVFHVLILKTFVNEIHRKDKIPQLHMYFLQIFSLSDKTKFRNLLTARSHSIDYYYSTGVYNNSKPAICYSKFCQSANRRRNAATAMLPLKSYAAQIQECKIRQSLDFRGNLWFCDISDDVSSNCTLIAKVSCCLSQISVYVFIWLTTSIPPVLVSPVVSRIKTLDSPLSR